MNYFNLFNIEQRFDIDIKNIQARYLTLQSKFHPDKAVNNCEQLKFLQYSTNINTAYKILIDNFARAQYILQLNDINLAEHNSINIDQNLLLQVIENAELLDSLNDIDNLMQLKAISTLKNDVLIDELTKLFALQDYYNATMKTIELKYHLKFLAEIQSKISQLYATSPNK